jgi:phosphate transport system substrate-binding protein
MARGMPYGGWISSTRIAPAGLKRRGSRGSGSKVLTLAGLLLGLILLAPVSLHAEPVRVAGTGMMNRTLTLLAEAYQRRAPGAQIVILPGLGSRGAKKGLTTGAVDIGFVAEPLSPADAEQGLVGFEYAKTALVFATADPSTQALTYQALVDIYAGRVTSWPDGRRLRLIVRPAGDSDNTILRSISPLFHEAVEAALKRDGMLVAATDQDAADAIASVAGALGTTTLALIVGEKRRLTPLALDGVTPSVETVASGTYPHTKTIHVVSRHQEPRPAVTAFVRFLQTPDARAIVAGTGFLPLPSRR